MFKLTSGWKMTMPLLLGFLAVAAALGAAEQEPRGFEPNATDLKEVNEGKLEFLLTPPDHPVHHHDNVLTLSESTLRHGWAQLYQCHHHLDPVARAEIVFREGRVRGLSIEHQVGIDKAWTGDHSVELRNVGRSSSLCLSAETKVMARDGRGGYVLRNGPFMRRFLDGYYPMRVTMRVHYPCGSLQISDIRPRSQPGFRISHSPCTVAIETLFQGRLNTEIRFRPSSTPEKPQSVKP